MSAVRLSRVRALVVGSACVLVASALVGAADGALRASPRLQAIADSWRGVGHPVLCEDDQAAWDADPHKKGMGGVTYHGSMFIHLSPRVCSGAEMQSFGGANYLAVSTFLHELIHSVGVTNEGQADCMMLGAYYQFVREYYSATHLTALAGWNVSWGFHDMLPPAYKPYWCRKPQVEMFATPIAPAIVEVKVVKKCYERRQANTKGKLRRIKCPVRVTRG